MPSLPCSPELVGKAAAATTSSLCACGMERALEDDDMERLRSLDATQVSLWALPSIKGDSLLVQVLEECPETKVSESIQNKTFFGWLSRMANKLSTWAGESGGMVGDQTVHLDLGFLSAFFSPHH